MRLIDDHEQFRHEFRQPVVLTSPDEKWVWRYGETTIYFRRCPASVRADAGKMHRDDGHAATDRLFSYSILGWDGVQDSRGEPMVYDPKLIRALPFDFRSAFLAQIGAMVPPGFRADGDDTVVTYRRLPAYQQRSIEERHSTRGVVNMHNMISDILDYTLLGWEYAYDISGQAVPFQCELIGQLPDDARGKLVELIYGSNTLDTELKNSNGALRQLTPSEVSRAEDAGSF